MDIEPPISDGDVSVKLSINVMMLFMHLHIHHSVVSNDCSLASCVVSPLSPHCNYRHASSYRIETLVFDPKLSVSSSALPLFCHCTKLQSNQKPRASAFSMFNYDEAIPDNFFGFNFFSDGGGDSEHALFYLYVLSEGDVLQIKDIGLNSSLYNNYMSFVAEQNSVDALQSVLQKFSKRYDGFKVMENFRLLHSHVSHLCGNLNDAYPNCITQSNELFQIVYKFQRFTSLRVGFIEGAHRHLAYVRKIYNMTLTTIGEDTVTSNVYFLRLQETQQTEGYQSPLYDSLFLKYFTFVDVKCDPSKQNAENAGSLSDDILTFARQESKSSMNTNKHSVSDEDVHE